MVFNIISNKLSSVKDSITNKIDSFVDEKRQALMVKVENISATGIILNWLISHKVIVFFTLLFLVVTVPLYLKIDKLNDQLLEAQIRELGIDLDRIAQENKDLKEKIKQLAQLKEDNTKQVIKVKEAVTNLDANKKKERCLEYVNRLTKRRGLK